jgi:hypothetical protein
VTQKRKDRSNLHQVVSQPPAPEPAPAGGGEAPPAEAKAPARTPTFWRVFGVAAAAVTAVVGVGAYQQAQSQINAQRREVAALNKELRKDLTELGGRYADMVKKEEHNSRVRTVWDTLKELRADRSDLTKTTERCDQLTKAYEAGEQDRRSLEAEVRRLRESQTAEDERAALTREIRALRERIAQIEGKPKAKAISAEGAEQD